MEKLVSFGIVPVQLGELLCKMIADIKEQDKTQELIKSRREHLLNAQKALDLLCDDDDDVSNYRVYYIFYDIYILIFSIWD